VPPIMRRRPLLRAAAIRVGAYRLGKRRQQEQRREASIQQRDQLTKRHDGGAPTDNDHTAS